jgi:hypothetical protein
MIYIKKIFKNSYNEGMKNKLPTILLTLSLTALLGFDVGQEVELDKYLNARTDPNFLKYNKNIKTTLAKGTTGEVLEVKKFNSGNAGIKMKVTNGPKSGQSYWVYYNTKTPAIKLTDKKAPKELKEKELKINEIQHENLKDDSAALGTIKDMKPLALTAEIPPDQSPLVPLANVEALTIQTVAATRDLEEHAVAATVGEVNVLKTEVNTVLNESIDRSKDCDENKQEEAKSIEASHPPVKPILNSYGNLSPIELETSYSEKLSIAPFREIPSKRVSIGWTGRDKVHTM